MISIWRFRGLVLGALFVLVAAASGLAAVLLDDVPVPENPLAKKAFEILEHNCARCHQAGRLVGRDKPSKGFGNILKMDEIAQNRTLIVPGNPYGSRLFKQIVDRDMPYDVMTEGADGPSPTGEDIKALEAWINDLAPPAAVCETHKFVSQKDIVTLIAADLAKLPRQRASATRYLTLTHFANICVDAATLKVYRQATIKLLNSLSRGAEVVKLETIDPDQSILRFNLDDLDWRAQDWDLILASDPYAVAPDTPALALLESATGVKLPFARADWFAFEASQPPLYNRLLRLPATFQALAEAESVDVEADIQRDLVKRAAFQKSGVSANNRLIERHPARTGYFWTSYDFAGNKDRQDLFAFPLGPGGPNGFRHDGGETIFSLPNGFQAYYLNNSQGQMLAKGPTSIVRDPSHKDLTVTNGISCMGCHDQGMRKAKDDIRASVMESRLFPRAVKEEVAALYPPSEIMDATIEQDLKRFSAAMTEAGLDPALKLNGTEMINALAKRYEDDVDAAAAAAELGLTKQELTQAGIDADKRLKLILRRLDQGLVPRDQFETSFKALAQDLTETEPLDFAAAGRGEAIFKAARKDGIALTSDKNVYRQGDSPVFTVISNTDCYLTLTDVDGRGRGAVLFPNRFQKSNRIRADVAFDFPGENAPFQYRMQDRGFETVIAVCTPDDRGVDGIEHDFDKSAFTVVENYTRSATRLITIESASKPGPSGAAPAANPARARFAPPHETLRAAIKVEVR